MAKPTITHVRLPREDEIAKLLKIETKNPRWRYRSFSARRMLDKAMDAAFAKAAA